jgi:hypothetical protein
MVSTRQRRPQRAWFIVVVLCVSAFSVTSAASTAAAQEFRATVTGKITDPSGLMLPGVTVTAFNPQTNETSTAVSSTNGVFSLPFLKPGLYTISAEIEGFRKTTHEKVQLEVGSTVTLTIQLQLGSVTETITVVSEAVDTSKGDRGMVVDNARVTELPLNARNPFMLSYLAPGITYNGPAIYQRPFDNGAIADWSINGGQNRNNEFLLDGAPNNAVQGGNNIAYVPPVDAVQEFKIITNSYDAQYGRSAGGVVNVSLKSGTNTLHGTAYEFARRKAWDANEFFLNANGREKPDHKLDQYGFQIDGPVKIPGLYDGTNKTFFMFNYEGYKELTPNPATLTFPSEAQLNGDFSDLRDAQGRQITIYDPATGRLVNGQWVRDPFPGNKIPQERLNPIARTLLSHFPRPNTTPPAGTDPWRSNYVFAPNLAKDDFYNIATKVDQNLSDKTRMFFRYAQNKRTEIRYSNGILSGPAQDGQLPLERINYTGVTDWVRTATNTLVLNFRGSVNQYIEAARSEPGLGFDPTELGFPSALAGELPNLVFPRINLTDYTSLGRQGLSRETTTVLSLQPNVSWIKGKHNIRSGLDARLTWYTRENNGNLFFFETDRRFTQRDFSQGDSLSGNAVASFLLGAPHGGRVDSNFFPEFRWNYYAPWLQDDWKLTDRLTLNLGLRWDLNSPIFEEQNRLNYGFNTEDVNPVTSRINQALFPGYVVRGGVEFVDVDGNPKYPYKYDKNNIQPRIGFAYLLNDSTILRGGYGTMYLNVTGATTQNGFGIFTPLVTSLDGNRTPTYALSNPYPNGISDPPGSSQGLETYLGRDPSFSNIDYDNPYVHQFSFSVQRLLPWRTTVEMSYVGSRTRKEQSSTNQFNDMRLADRDRCDVTKGGSANYCNEQVPNPFYQVAGFEGTSRFTSPTIARSELLRPFPQYTGFTMWERNDGKIWYNSAQLMVNKRMSDGITLAGTYTWAKMIEESGFMDYVAGTMARRPYTTDRRHRVTISGVYHLPFGNGRKFLGKSNRVVDSVVSGWEMAGMWLFNSGRPWELPENVFYVKDAHIENIQFNNTSAIRGVTPCVAQQRNDGTIVMQSFSTAAGCTEPNFIIRPSFTGSTTPQFDDRIRRPPFYQFDMNFAKTTRLAGNTRLQFRFEVFNVLNQAMYDERQYERNTGNAAFGTIDKKTVRQSNFPRYMQLGVKVLF